VIRVTHITALLLACAAVLAGLARAQEPRVEPRAEPLRVVATIEDLGGITRAIGGDRVEVTVIARDGQNLHGVRVKPSHLVALSKADVFVQVGLSLEHAWVPGLLEAARNTRVQPGGVGFVDAGAGFATIDVPESLDRARGVDVHPQGNPHVNLSVDGGPHFARAILAGLVRVDPEGEALFRANFAEWERSYAAARERWERAAAACARAAVERGAPFAVLEYHREFDYLLRFLGVEVAGTLEPKPGVPPTPAHLRELVKVAVERGARVVVTASWSSDRTTKRFAEQCGASVLELALTTPTGSTWIEGLDAQIARLVAALGVVVPAETASSGAESRR
jgi:ABC-type Zn uptake system ZnuABC Zn-binding protein ZnuA